MNTTDAVIRVDSLVKTFGTVRALDGLDLDIRAGEVHGFLGPNGAGKSTTIRILLGLIRATAGQVRVFGADPWRDGPRVHSRLAYVAGDVALWPGLTGGQCLDILIDGQGTGRRGMRSSRLEALIDRFDLDPTKRVRDYSKGNRQKVALVAALAADAELLILDEPTSGLDPLMEHVFQKCVRERRNDGCTVLLSSHILAEVEALADRVSIVRRGRTVSTGTLADLRKHARIRVHAVTVHEAEGLTAVPGVTDYVAERVADDVDTRFSVDAEHLDGVLGSLHAATIRTLTITPPSLDDLFLRNYPDSADDARIALVGMGNSGGEATR